MNKKILTILIIVVILTGIGYWVYTNISFVDNEQLNNINIINNSSANITNTDIMGDISIYLIDISTKTLKKESRSVSLKLLNSNPYLTILEELKKETNNLTSPIPINTKINSCNIENGILVIDLSNDFIKQETSNNLDKLILQSIVNTMSNLKEISDIQITIEGKTSEVLGTYTLSKAFNISSFN